MKMSWFTLLLTGLLAFSASAQDKPRVLILGGKDESQMTIGELKPAYIDFSYRANPKLSVKDIVARYVKLLKEAEDPEVRLKALQRLGSLENLYGETVESVLDREAIGRIAIQTYEEHLAAYPSHPENDWVLYQLARSYEMAAESGNTRRTLERLVKQYPRSELVSDSLFRVAEIRYAQGEYAAAETAFRDTLKSRQGGPYRLSAEYMLGWSLFQQSRLDPSMDTFISVLKKLNQQAAENQRVELRNDVLRIMSVIAGRQSGTDSLFAALERNRSTELAPLVYEHQYRYYLSNQRYQDAAGVAAHYIERFPMSAGRLDFHQRRVEAYREGNLPTLVRQEKQAVVNQLGADTAYYRSQKPEDRQALEATLSLYLSELGQFEYAMAGKAPEKDRQAHYEAAASYFDRLTAFSPESPEFASVYFLMGESYQKLGKRDQALAAYRKAGYTFPDYEKRVEAAYAVVDTFPAGALDSQPALRSERADEFERFATTYPDDARSSAVLLAAANERYAMAQYEKAKALSAQVLEPPYRLTMAQQTDARLLQGHVAFAMSDYVLSQSAYEQARTGMKLSDERLLRVNENLAASLYRQGESLQKAGDTEGARQFYLQVVERLPDTQVAEVAMYDAAMRSIDLALWFESAALLQGYRERYPEKSAEREVSRKLVYVHQQNQNYAAAADELVALQGGLTGEDARKAQFQAVELYQQAGFSDRAARAAEDYIRLYPQPFEPWIAMHQTRIELAQAAGDAGQTRKLQAALVEAEKSGGSARTTESRTLAAAASWELAQPAIEEYQNMDLRLPLNKSLTRKSAALKDLMNRLSDVHGYGVTDYVTASTHAMGEAYRQLSQSIIRSETPAGLSELEQEQYTLLLEEQAYPFEEKAIEFLENNTARTSTGVYDEWVEKSFENLAEILPVRYAKEESAESLVMRVN